jgi:hypothetical protein
MAFWPDIAPKSKGSPQQHLQAARPRELKRVWSTGRSFVLRTDTLYRAVGTGAAASDRLHVGLAGRIAGRSVEKAATAQCRGTGEKPSWSMNDENHDRDCALAGVAVACAGPRPAIGPNRQADTDDLHPKDLADRHHAHHLQAVLTRGCVRAFINLPRHC